MFLLAELRYEEEHQYNEYQDQSDIENEIDDSSDSIRNFIDNAMYEMMQEQERKNDLVYKPEPLPTK
jgi:hypothetical protein